MDVFDDLVSFGAYDSSNRFQKAIAEFCFMKLLQSDLNYFQQWWNTHHVRRTRTSGCPGGLPQELFDFPEMYGARNNLKSVQLQDVNLLLQESRIPPTSTDHEVHQICQDLCSEYGWNEPTDWKSASELFLRIQARLQDGRQQN